MVGDNKYLSKEVLRLLKQYQDHLVIAPYEPCISERQIAEYKQEYEKLMDKFSFNMK